MELNEYEKYALSIFQVLTNNNISKERLIDYIIQTEEDLNESNINWLKIAIQLDNIQLVDAVLLQKNIKENQINEAIQFGFNLNSPKKNKDIFITLELPNKKTQNQYLSLDYIRKKHQDFAI